MWTVATPGFQFREETHKLHGLLMWAVQKSKQIYICRCIQAHTLFFPKTIRQQPAVGMRLVFFTSYVVLLLQSDDH